MDTNTSPLWIAGKLPAVSTPEYQLSGINPAIAGTSVELGPFA